MSQEQVAAQALTFRLLGELERGRGNPSLSTLFLLAKALGVSVSDLVDVEGAIPTDVPLKHRKIAAPKRGRKPAAKKTRGA